ncbi:nuclease-related domain-containing protein [Oceanobacillus massiliensis]|uniref:nuclease-related domain-containing protein n=1 Tax=Oceanobacillus massiliensis TaxID=1465765 RepID=UPI000289EDFB|nr:nuclease-related domain-containing protein [Oceanobacillus massiliensis]
MLALRNLFKVKKEEPKAKETVHKKKSDEYTAVRKGETGEYKVAIQLSQLPKEYRHLNDLLIANPKSASGYSQIDHVVITPYGIFVIETKNFQGTIYGGKERKTWLVNGKFKMMNPVLQNYGHIQALKNLLHKRFRPHFQSIVSFTKRCRLKIDMDLRDIKSDELVIYDLYLTESILRKVALLKLKYAEPILNEADINHIHGIFAAAAITDPAIRRQHIEKLKRNSQKTL